MHAQTHEPPAPGNGEDEDGDDRATSRRREQRLAALATRQHGVVARRQLAALGFGRGAIAHRQQLGRLHPLHRSVYVVGHRRLGQRGHWMAAVLTGGADAVLSHRSAAALWGLVGARGLVDITSSKGRPGRKGIRLHVGRLLADERTERDGIPATTVARTLLDLGDTANEEELRRAFEEADRLNILQVSELARVCDRGAGRHGIGTCRRLIASLTAPSYTRSALEELFAEFCRTHKLPPPSFNCSALGFEVDALWPRQRLIVELDGFAFHRHRAAFERDRARDTALQVAGYRVVHLTHRRLDREGMRVAQELRLFLHVAKESDVS